MPYVSEKDKNDILFGIENDFDFIAASFTRSCYDILEIKKILEDNNGPAQNIQMQHCQNVSFENITVQAGTQPE